MSGKVYRSKENNEKLARRKGHFQRTPTESNSDVPSTINTTVESFNAFGITESVQLNSSEEDLPLRSPFAKNTLPADLLARQLAQVVEHQPQLSSEEKVHIWRWEAVVSPVEDVHNFQDLFAQREATLANLNKNKRRSKTKTKKCNKEEVHYNFKEFRERLEKDLHESVKVRNILQFSRFKAAVKNLTTNTTRKRSTKADIVDSEEPKTKIRKKFIKVDTVTESNKQLNKSTPNRKQQQQKQQTTKQFVVNIKPMTKRQQQQEKQKTINKNKKPRQNIEKAKEVEETNNKHENSLIVFREDFTNKTLHLDKKRAEIFKNFENTKTPNNNNNNNTPSDNEQISATNNETTTTTNANDSSTVAGVFHQQHVFCNYLGLTGMSTANALATAAAELSNCATRRFSLRVRQNQQKEKKQQQQQKVAKAKPTPTDNEISKGRMSTSKQPPKIVSLDIKKAKEISSLKTQNLLNMNSMRAKFSVGVERRDPVPVRIVHRYSSICEERPKPVESSNVFMLPKLKPPISTVPRKPIFSAEFVNSFKPKITPVSSAPIQRMENKKLNISTKFLMPKKNNLIAEPQSKSNLMTNDLTALKPETAKTQHAAVTSVNMLKSEQKSQLHENCVLKQQPLKVENKVEITSIEIMKPAAANNELKHESIRNALENDDFKQIDTNEVSTLKAEISRTEQQPERETETSAAVIVEEKPLIEINSNLNINKNFESENNTAITVEAIQALTENDIIFADDFLMTVENANDTNKIISNNNGVDLIEEVDETDVREQFVPFINNVKNVQDCLTHENENNDETKLDESSNINNMHSVDPLHNDINTNNLVHELPLILCHENNVVENIMTNNSQENQIAETTATPTAPPLPHMPINTNGNNEMFLQQGSIVSIVASDSNHTEMCTQQTFSNNVAVVIDNKAASEENIDKNVPVQNLYKNVQYFHNISTKQTQNPLIYKYGKVLYMYYELDVLLVVQELMISFWKCSKLLNALKIAKLEELECNKNEWLLLDVCPRSLKDIEIPAPYSSRICIYNGMTHYCELRGFHVPSEEHFFSLYVNVYFYNEEELQGKKRTIVLDSVRSIPQEITYITLFESHYIVFCWSQIVQEKRQKTGMCKYSLAPHFERIACIRDFKELNQHIKHLECINDKLYGYGETTLTVWDHRSGDVFMNFDFQIPIGRNIGSIYYQSPEIEQNNMMLLFQHVSTSTAEHELLLIMCSVSHITPSYRILKRLPLPMPAFQAGVSSAENNGEHIMIRAKKTNVELWISCADPNTMLLMPPQKSQCFYVRGRPQVINVTENSLAVDTIINHLLKLQAVDNSLNGHHLSTCN